MLISRAQWEKMKTTLDPESKLDRQKALTVVIDEVVRTRNITNPNLVGTAPPLSYYSKQYFRPVVGCRWNPEQGWRFVIEHQWFGD